MLAVRLCELFSLDLSIHRTLNLESAPRSYYHFLLAVLWPPAIGLIQILLSGNKS